MALQYFFSWALALFDSVKWADSFLSERKFIWYKWVRSLFMLDPWGRSNWIKGSVLEDFSGFAALFWVNSAKYSKV